LSVDHISQTLNRHGRESFHEFISRHRIEYAKSLLRRNEHGQRKMLDIAMESGFNSQSTFYSYFKKYQHQTPAAFRAEQLKRYREVNESSVAKSVVLTR
jgi:AraC-like DNA-binding protein